MPTPLWHVDQSFAQSLSYMGDLELEQQRHQSNIPCTSESPEVDVVGLDEEEESSGGSKRIPGSPLKRQLEYLQWEDGEMGSACEWVGQVSSQLRISLYSEEVAEGCMADAARGTLWKSGVYYHVIFLALYLVARSPISLADNFVHELEYVYVTSLAPTSTMP
ncbi:hypothetical protein E2C01_025676 [Portunus trituberculatus]|uniref:Uncharacterized protein n=1 Tax=Portunus trituberculatus TaxID=210409 RepID=A0A5B7EGC6_PORTR|nr:hypothetical protein [Portunus trituberculatus]